MKIITCSVLLFIGSHFFQAQQITLGDLARQARFSKVIDEVNNGKTKIKYSDISGIPYYTPGFVNARVGDTSSFVPIRYNSFLDTIEIMDKNEVYEIPREESYPKFTFDKSNLKLVLVNTYDEFAGYFFEIAGGKNRILKKIQTKYYDAVPAPNSLISAIPARFETQKPIYFLKTDDEFIRLPKNAKDLPALLPARKAELESFIKSNKIKINDEADLIKLAAFLNS
ncbi:MULTISPECIES: hypothetical protein [Chryseobacterium]|uniref:hypothetical protein n=1 Tax=Chryseobacterium sp. R2A-55 TaxID=2744445 RepID=UPI001F45BDD7|nr:hypothetical protein [Chryseobacterium sp. R2A-55]